MPRCVSVTRIPSSEITDQRLYLNRRAFIATALAAAGTSVLINPELNARGFKPKDPWTITVEGECARRGSLNLEDVLKGQTLEDRVYRHRCVEGWSMVIPWVGFPLSKILGQVQPTSQAKYVAFETLADSK